MKKRLLILTMVSALTLAAPVAADASEQEWNAQEQIDERGIGITLNHSTLDITGANGMTLEVVSLTGKPVMTVKIESPAQRVELNVPKGCYILKIGKVVRKVAVR